MKDYELADDATKKAELELVDKAIGDLRKHFDCVQIFASKVTKAEDVSIGREPDNTIYINKGSGNIFARMGHAQIWLAYQEEIERQKARTE